MTLREQSELMDKILKESCDHIDYLRAANNYTKVVSGETLWKKAFQHIKKEDFYFLLGEIEKFGENAITINKKNGMGRRDFIYYLEPTVKTRHFLSQGGFKRHFSEKEQEEHLARVERVDEAIIREQTMLLNDEAIKNIAKTKHMYWISWLGAIAAWAAVIVQLVLALWN